MARENLGSALREVATLYRLGATGGLTDAQLLETFTSHRDESAELAFRTLVERHGPMVLGVCRAVLRDADAAADAFQATFLVLVRRGASLWVRDSLGPWLNQVAYRTASGARSATARRKHHERRAAEMSARTGHDDDRDDLGAIVYEELGRLPARYRDAVVLCLLEGLTPEQAAGHLNCPVGTVHSRLARGRAQLRGRLTRRGLAVPSVLLAMRAAHNPVFAAVPPALAHATIEKALRLAVTPVAIGTVPASLITLTRPILQTALAARIGIALLALVIVIAGLAVVGAGVLAHQGPGDPVPSAAPQKKRVRVAAEPVTADALVDPLPAGARLRLGTSRFRPPSMVSELALAPDEKTIVTVGDQLIAWDATTGKERWRVHGREYGFEAPAAAYGMHAVAFAADGARFLTPGRPGLNEFVVWNTVSGQHEVRTIARPSRLGERANVVRSIDITPDGQKLAVGSGDGVVVCDPSGKVLYAIDNAHERFHRGDNDRLGLYGPYSLGRFSPDATILAVVTSDRPSELRLYDATTGREFRKISLKDRLVRLAFSPSGQQIATTERDSAVRLYDVATGRQAWSHTVKLTNIYENYTSAIAFSPDQKVLAVCATDHLIYLIDPATGAETGQLTGHHWYPWALAFGANNKVLYSSGWDSMIRRWDPAAGKQVAFPQAHHATGVVAASADGQTLAYEDDEGAIRIVDSRDGTPRRTLTLPGTAYAQLKFSPDGRLLAGGGTSGENVHVAVWDIPGGQLVDRWDWPKGRDPHSTVESLDFTPDGRRLAAAVFRQSKAYVWDLTVGQQIAQLAHNQIYDLSFSPDGATLVTGGWDSIFRFWETDTGTLRKEIKAADRAGAGDLPPAGPPPAGGRDVDLRVFSICCAPAGRLIATVHLDGLVRIWQADNMRLRKQFQMGEWGYGRVRFSPDGLWLAGGMRDGSVELWDPLSASRVWNTARHQSDVDTVGFGRDARTLVSGGQDGLCYLWDLRPQGKRPEQAPARLWEELAGDNGPAAYDAMWALADQGDGAVAELAERLRAVTTVIDLDHVEEGKPAEEIERLRRMKKILVNKDSKIESAIAVRRAIAVLAQIGTPEAVGLLKRLSERDSHRDVAPIAAAALDRP